MSFGIKRMQNGSIGEARTKSFLIDRFWILERSVDIDGADFIVQIRLIGEEAISQKLTKFGRIQSKYCQDGNTQIRLKKDYVVDSQGKERLDFFLIVCTGIEDTQSMYLLTANDILTIFGDSEKLKESNVFCFYSKRIFNDRYLIKNKQFALNRIEKSIDCSDYFKNRSFIFTELNTANPKFNNILPEFTEDIEYSSGRIPEMFREKKVVAYNSILEIENVYSLLKEFVETIDPIEATIIAEKLLNKYPQRILKLPEIFSQDFYYILVCHKELIMSLKKEGALDNYIMAKTRIQKSLNEFLRKQNFVNNENLTHKITILYDSDNFEINNISNHLEVRGQKEFLEFLTLTEGNVSLSYKIGLQAKVLGHYRVNDYVLMQICKKMYELKCYD
ncbi:MAG: hypothetical protein ACOCWC_05915 [Bacteroidota bacterium]